MWYTFKESGCLGMQPKMGGKYHLKLNNDERPIANKYREGKMKRTLKRELNSTWNCQKGNAWNQYCWQEISRCLWGAVHFSVCKSTSVWLWVKILKKVAFGCYSFKPCSGLDWGLQCSFGFLAALEVVYVDSLLIACAMPKLGQFCHICA